MHGMNSHMWFKSARISLLRPTPRTANPLPSSGMSSLISTTVYSNSQLRWHHKIREVSSQVTSEETKEEDRDEAGTGGVKKPHQITASLLPTEVHSNPENRYHSRGMETSDVSTHP